MNDQDLIVASRPILNTSVPLAVGTKFQPNGQVREYKGNTVVCHVDPSSELHGFLSESSTVFAQSPAGASMVFLPPKSFHMTLFQGLNDQVRGTAEWSRMIAANLPFEDVSTALRDFLKLVRLPKSFRMRPTGFAQGGKLGGLVLNLEGLNPEEDQKLSEARAALAVAMGLEERLKNDYQFHISLSYQIRWMTPAEHTDLTALSVTLSRQVFEQFPEILIETPEFCTFNSMFHFEPVLRLCD